LTIDEQTPQEETPVKTVWRYAQIDDTGKCITVSLLSGEVIADNMIELTDEDDVSPLDTLVDGAWVKYIPPVPEPPGPSVEEQIQSLQAQNDQLQQQLAQTNADLTAVLEMILIP
jgi:hypothetical protein